MVNFSERMRELRLEKGYKKTDVARGTGLDRSTITKYESGERDNPTKTVLKTLSNFFGVTMGYLAGISDIRDPDITSKVLNEIFNCLDDNRKIDLVKYAKYLKKEQEDGERVSD